MPIFTVSFVHGQLEWSWWKAHVKYLLGKVGKRIGMLGRARKNISMHSANKVYKSYIIPVLDYCDTVWNFVEL